MLLVFDKRKFVHFVQKLNNNKLIIKKKNYQFIVKYRTFRLKQWGHTYI